MPDTAIYLNDTDPAGRSTTTPEGDRSPRVAVVGAGGVGSYFAARAALAGAEVTLCLRRAQDQFVVRSGGQELRPLVRTVRDPADLGDVDWVMLGVKAHQTPGAAAWLAVADRPEAEWPPPVVIMQNGVRLADRVQGLWRGPVIPAVVFCGVEVIGPGVVEHRSYGYLEVQQGPAASRLAGLFGPDQHEIKPVPDVVRASWEKLISNSAVNSITALTGRRLEVMGEPATRQLAVTVMQECVSVATRAGVTLDADIVETVINRVTGLPAEQGSSMLYDRLAGRPLEHEALIGAVVNIGADYGVPTPASSALLALLQAVSGRPLPSPE